MAFHPATDIWKVSHPLWVASPQKKPRRELTAIQQQFVLILVGGMLHLLSSHLYQCTTHHHMPAGEWLHAPMPWSHFQKYLCFSHPPWGAKIKSVHMSNVTTHHSLCTLEPSDTIPALNFPVMPHHRCNRTRTPSTSYTPRCVNYLVAIRRNAVFLEWGLLSSAEILLRSTLNADFTKRLTSARRLAIGK